MLDWLRSHLGSSTVVPVSLSANEYELKTPGSAPLYCPESESGQLWQRQSRLRVLYLSPLRTSEPIPSLLESLPVAFAEEAEIVSVDVDHSATINNKQSRTRFRSSRISIRNIVAQADLVVIRHDIANFDELSGLCEELFICWASDIVFLSDPEEYLSNEYRTNLARKQRSKWRELNTACSMPKPTEIVATSDLENEGLDLSKKVLFAGHDFKFLNEYIEYLKCAGVQVAIDKWTGHARHNSKVSRRLLHEADIIFCEWGLGNAVWYSKRKAKKQRLIVRIHAQEFRAPFLEKINLESIDTLIGISPSIRDSLAAWLDVSPAQLRMIPNYVRPQFFETTPLSPGVNPPRIGFVGATPQNKRLDIALDILEDLKCSYPAIQLWIKGRTPDELTWVQQRPDEVEFFRKQMRRIDEINSRWPESVIWEKFSVEIQSFYSCLTAILSTSDRESFHFSIADGAASKVQPYILDWPGADLLYPRKWIYSDKSSLVAKLEKDLSSTRHDGKVLDPPENFIREHFSEDRIFRALNQIVFNRS